MGFTAELKSGIRHSLKLIFVGAADRAFPVIGKIFEGGTRGSTIIRIANCRFISIITELAHVTFHLTAPLLIIKHHYLTPAESTLKLFKNPLGCVADWAVIGNGIKPDPAADRA
jgi:hypothetical protein